MKLRRMLFGAKSEKAAIQFERVELELEELVIAQASEEIVAKLSPQRTRPGSR